MERPGAAFWTLASVLTEVPEAFTLLRARIESGGAELVLSGPVGVTATLRTVDRHAPPARGELRRGEVALRYRIRGSLAESPEAHRHALAAWLDRLVATFPSWRSLLAPGSRDERRARVCGRAEAGPLEGLEVAWMEDLDESGARDLEIGDPVSEHRVLLRHAPDRPSPDGSVPDGAPWSLRPSHRTPAPVRLQDALRVAGALALDARTDPPTERRGHHALDVLTADDHPQRHEVRLLLNGPCRQRCAFCSIPDTFVPDAGTDADLAAYRALLEARHARGARVLRLTGVDPLASPFIVELIATATALGFTDVSLNSPSTRLADRAFAERLAAAMPARRSVMIPIYGIDPAMHDRVVDRAGAHAEVMAAIAHAIDLLGDESVQLSTVLVPEVLPALAGLEAFALARRLTLNVYLPFPDRDSPFDRFARVTSPQSKIADAILRQGLPVGRLFTVSGMLPCIARAAAIRAGQGAAADAWLAAHRAAVLYDGARTARDPCPHRDRCDLTPPCSGTLLRAYVRHHGLGELAPRAPE